MKEILHFDIRTKIIMLIMMNILLFVGNGILYEIILIAYCSIILLLSGKWHTMLKFDVLFALMVSIDLLVSHISTGSFWQSLFLFIVVIFRRFLPIFMTGKLIFATKVSEFITCMWKLKMPKHLIISISVIFRFFPTIREEWQAILASMEMRGIGFNFLHFITHPLRTIEYLLVPLLINAVKISEELAEAALCRGLDCENQHTCLTEVKMKSWDIIVCIILILTAGIKIIIK